MRVTTNGGILYKGIYFPGLPADGEILSSKH